jgi:hypothetical protein
MVFDLDWLASQFPQLSAISDLGSGYSGEAGRVFRSYSATQNDSGRPPAKGYV